MDSKKVIEKLISIAEKQQKIIQKLAQAQDPNIAYLKQVGEAAAINTGAGVPISVQVTANTPQANPDPGITTTPGYTMRVSGFTTDDMKTKFKTNLDNTLKLQKPELLDNLSVFYT